MPRIKQTKMLLGIDPNRPRKETIIYINYDNQEDLYHGEPEGGRFYVMLPEVMAVALAKKEVRGKTHYEAWTAFTEALKQFKNMKTEINRVILYQFDLRPHPSAERSRYSSNDGLRVSVWAGTYEETIAISGMDQRNYSYERIDSSLEYEGEPFDLRGRRRGERYPHQVPWADKNETFFKWIEDKMNELIIKLAELENPEKLIETVNAGRLLPLGNQEKGGKD